jgi:hypothetical protein
MTGRHVRTAIADQRAVLAVARAVLNVDPEAAHKAAAPTGTCPECVTIAAVQLGFAWIAELTGAPMVTGKLRETLLAAVERAEARLREAGN